MASSEVMASLLPADIQRETPDVEARLVRAAQQGDRAAFDRLVASHAHAVLRSAAIVLGSQEDAEDVAQETFIAAYRNIATYRPEAPFGAWLHRIAINRSYDLIRSRQRRAKLVEEVGALQPTSEADQALESARLSERNADVRELIAGLDEKMRALVTLRFLEGMKVRDIAIALDMPEGTVKRRLHDVLKLLRTRMEGANA